MLVQEAADVSSNSEPLERPRGGLEVVDDCVVVLPFVVRILMKVPAEEVAQVGEAVHVHVPSELRKRRQDVVELAVVLLHLEDEPHLAQLHELVRGAHDAESNRPAT